LTVSTIKNLKFQKSKIAAAAILKNLKIAISRPLFGNRKKRHVLAAVQPILTKFGLLLQFDLLDRSDR